MREKRKEKREERKEREGENRVRPRWSKGRRFFFSFKLSKCSTSGSKGEEPKETKNK